MTTLRYTGTGHCPMWAACIACGTTGAKQADPTTDVPGPLAVATVDTPYGPLCLSVCWGCSATGWWLPRLTADAVMRLVIAHRAHVTDGGAR